MKRYEGELIFEGSDAFGIVEVVDRGDVRTLHFGSPTEQSSIHMKHPYALETEYMRVMALGMLFQPHPQRVLCLGMGGGSLPKFIWKNDPACRITAVECSPLVIEVAYRYFDLPRDPRLTVAAEDALDYIKKEEGEPYDLIFVDLFVSSGIAFVVADPDFFLHCYNRLKPGGLLVWNSWRSTGRDLIEYCVRNLCTVFGRNLLILPNRESLNQVFFLFREPIAPHSREEIVAVAQEIDASFQTDSLRLLEELHYFKDYGYLFQDWS